MKLRNFIGVLIIAMGLGLAAVNFFSATIEYGTFAQARVTSKKMQVKGSWIRERGIQKDETLQSISFAMVDEVKDTVVVVLSSFLPSNFELASSIVVKGKFENGVFHATEVLTKCPSKYESSTTLDFQ